MWQMPELEKILKGIQEWAVLADNDDVHVSGKIVEFLLCKYMNDGWISVEKELPPNSKHEGEFCPKYQVMTKYGVTYGWYNPDVKGWYVLIWFMTDRFLETEIDFDRGDKPKVTFLPDEVNNIRHILTAWRPLPEPYQPERSKQ